MVLDMLYSFKNNPIAKESIIVIIIINRFFLFWENSIFVSKNSTILMAGNAINSSITTENTRVTTISITI